MEIKCQECGNYYKDSLTQCPNCNLSPETLPKEKETLKNKVFLEKKCSYCAMMIPKEAKICPYCRKKTPISGMTGLVIIIIFTVIIIWAMSSVTPTTPRTVSSPNTVPDAPISQECEAGRDCYKLEKGAMVFGSVLHINQYMELIYSKGNVATEYFNDLVNRKLAFQTNRDLIVYKFDEFYVGGGNFLVCRVKLQDGTVLGWIFERSLKKQK